MRGALHGTPPVELVTSLVTALEARGMRGGAVDDLLLGGATQVDEQGATWRTPRRSWPAGASAEAFAALCLRFQRDLYVRDDRLNPDGGTLALGHAFGATGAILLLDVVDELERHGGRYGVAAVSGAAGVGEAMVVERVA